jgi:hypothetical protein
MSRYAAEDLRREKNNAKSGVHTCFEMGRFQSELFDRVSSTGNIFRISLQYALAYQEAYL